MVCISCRGVILVCYYWWLDKHMYRLVCIAGLLPVITAKEWFFFEGRVEWDVGLSASLLKPLCHTLLHRGAWRGCWTNCTASALHYKLQPPASAAYVFAQQSMCTGTFCTSSSRVSLQALLSPLCCCPWINQALLEQSTTSRE
jgi:hypothetical protein